MEDTDENPRVRLLADTCSLMKLLTKSDNLFEKGLLPSGDLIIHPDVHREVRKWSKAKKQLYSEELRRLSSISAEAGIRVSGVAAQRNQRTISSTIDQTGKPIGRVDREQISSAISYSLDLVTNDGPMTEAAIGLEITVYTAEQIMIEAYDEGLVSKEEIQEMVVTWVERNEKPISKEDKKLFSERKIKT